MKFIAAAPVTGTQLCTGRDANGGVPAGYYPGAACTGVPTGTALIKVPSQATTGTGWRWVSYGGVAGAVVATANGVTISGLDIDGTIDTGNNSGVTIGT